MNLKEIVKLHIHVIIARNLPQRKLLHKFTKTENPEQTALKSAQGFIISFLIYTTS